METLYITLDNALGDNIICAGLLAYLAQKNRVFIRISPAQEKNRVSYKTFFTDIPNLILLDETESQLEYPPEPVIECLGQPVQRRHDYKPKDPFKQLGYNMGFTGIAQAKNFKHTEYPLGFYNYFKLPYSQRFKYCPLRRNSFKVKQLGAIKGSPYAFVFDDKARGFVITRKGNIRLPEITTLFRPNTSVLAYRNIIENAAEIHCIDSSFFHLVNSFKPKGKLFYHKYARPRSQDFPMHPEWTRILELEKTDEPDH